MGLVCLKGLIDCAAILTKRRRWKNNATSVQAPIVDRKLESNDYAESREEEWDCQLAVERFSPAMNLSDSQTIWIPVSKQLYDRYERRNCVDIFYDPEDPDVFIIDGE